jgi:hypothetical protein
VGLLLVSAVHEWTGEIGTLFLVLAGLAVVVTVSGLLLPNPRRALVRQPAPAE